MQPAAAEPADDRQNAEEQAAAASAAPSEGIRPEAAAAASAASSGFLRPQVSTEWSSAGSGANEQQGVDPDLTSILEETEEEEENHQIKPRGSVYCFMVFLPPLSVKRFGHYWTKDVIIAFFLFCVCTVLQLSLSILGGGQMINQHKEDQLSLVQEVDSKQTYLSVLEHWPLFHTDFGKKASDVPREQRVFEKVLEEYISDLQRLHLADETEHCCQGVECSGFGVQCCTPAGPGGSKPALLARPPQQLRRQEEHRPAARWGATGISSLLRWALERRPGGGGGKGRQKGLKDGGGEAPVTQPVCIDTHGILSCTSHSVAVVPLWGDLDVDGDGRWTYWEALTDVNNLGCHLQSPLVEIFRSACEGIVRDAQDTAALMNHSGYKVDLPPELTNHMAISHSYFEWWQGLVGICQHANADLCEELLMRGTFDGTLAESRAFLRGGIINIHTALKYCQRLLRVGGVCEDALPGLYPIWRSRMQEKCGSVAYSKGPHFKNPYQDSDGMTLMSVSFNHLEEMKYVHSPHFTFFLWLILILWYINLINEAQELMQLFDFLCHVKVVNRWPFFTPHMKRSWRSWSRHLRLDSSLQPQPSPSTSKRAPTPTFNEASPLVSHLMSRQKTRMTSVVSGFSGAEDVGYEKIVIREFARPHFYTCVCIACIRTVILLLIGYAGTNFLLSNHTVLDLLLNALALAFIFELDEFLFEYLLSGDSKELIDKLAPLRYKSKLPAGICMSLMSERIVWGSFFIPALAFLVVYVHNTYSVTPYIEALECLCMQKGDRCLVNMMFYQSWWDDYWSKMAALS